MATNLEYRPELDGLRALAVLSVIVFHLNSNYLPGGYLGVDVFFVLSGYLITNILLQNRHKEFKEYILHFYERRCRRILPALVVVVWLTLLCAWLLLSPPDMRRIGQSAIAVLAFSSNVYFWKTQDYFAPQAGEQPLLHTWSLGVEEQFYILFPILIYCLRNKKRWLDIKITVFLIVLSFVGFIIGSIHFPAASFYLLPTRGWELMLGALVAIKAHSCNVTNTRFMGGAAATLGLIMIVGSLLAPVSNDQIIMTALAVIGTALTIEFIAPTMRAYKILASALPVRIGLLSYSAYLVHQPVLAIAKLAGQPTDQVIWQGGYLMIIFGFAYAIWRLVETKPRRSGFLTQRAIFAASFAVIGITLMAGRIAQLHGERQGIEIGLLPEKLASDCLELKSDVSKCRFIQPPGRPAVVLWGDSYADAFANSLGKILQGEGLTMLPLVKHSCPSLVGVTRNVEGVESVRFASECRRYAHDSIATIAKLRPQAVILSSAYSWYASGLNRENEKPILTSDDHADGDGADAVLDGLASATAMLNEAGITPLIVLPHPTSEDFSNSIRATGTRNAEPRLFLLDEEKSERLSMRILDRLDREHASYSTIRVSDVVCKGFGPSRLCSAMDGSGHFLLYDGSHFSAIGAPLVARAVKERIRVNLVAKQ